MDLHIYKTPGLRNDLLLVIDLSDIEDALFHVGKREELMELPGLLRHVALQDPGERMQVNASKIPVDEHLQAMKNRGEYLQDSQGRPQRCIVAIGSRNVGNNHGFVAWERDKNPKLFHVKGDPLNYPNYSCLASYKDGRLAIRPLRFAGDHVLDGDKNISEGLNWCVFGNQVLKAGKVVSIEEIIDQFYDIRHVLAFDRNTPTGKQIETEIYQDYPEKFREKALRALEKGIPRNRYLHNSLGLSEEKIFILQREGTVEEVANWLKEVGARDGIILDNGASPFCWAWWLYPNGGFLFTAPDYRPKASAVIVFVLKGPVKTDLPASSVSYSVV